MSTPTSSSGTILNPSSNTGWNRAQYAAGYERATYQKQRLIPYIEDGQKLLGSTIIRKAARVQGATLAQTSDGTGVTYVNPMGTPVTVTAVGYVVPIGWSMNEDAQVDLSIEQISGEASSAALAELLEAAAAANFQSGTQIIANPVADAVTLRQALAKLTGNTNGGGIIDGDRVYGYFSNTQMPSLMAIPEVNSAEMRGDSENPYVSGLWVKGFGLVMTISTVVPQDANGYHNGVFKGEALTFRWNERSRVDKQNYEYRRGFYGFANAGSAVVHDLRLVVVRTS